MEIKFNQTVRKANRSFRVTIPLSLVRSFGITPGKKYNFTIEVEEHDARA